MALFSWPQYVQKYLARCPPCSCACTQYVLPATRGLNHSKAQLLPTLCRSSFLVLQSNCQKSGGSILCTTSKEGGEEGSVKRQLLVDRSSSVICKKHQEFLIIRPWLVDQPKPSAFYQETGTAPCNQMTNALLQLFLTTFNWIADSFDESQLFDKKWSKGESLSSSERFRERLAMVTVDCRT